MGHFEPFPEIETERLVLRETTATDVDEVHFLRSDPRMLVHLKKAPMKGTDEAVAFISSLRAKRLSQESIEWCIARKPVARMIGSICLWNFSADRSKGEVGYLLHPAHRQQGIMSEAINAVVTFGFESLQLKTIEAYTHRQNLPSLRLLAAHGFREMTDRVDDSDEENVILVLERPY